MMTDSEYAEVCAALWNADPSIPDEDKFQPAD